MARTEIHSRRDLQAEFLDRFLNPSPESTAMFERGMDTIEVVERDQGALAIFGEHIQNGAVPVIATNHASLFDGFVIAKLVDMTRRRSNGILQAVDLEIAESLATGRQGAEADMYFNAVKPFLREYGVELDLSIPTQNDVHYREIKRPKKDSLSDYLAAAPQEGRGFAVFPEGTVKGGRRNPHTGELYGMRRVKSENDMTRFIDAVREKGHDAVILLGGVEGTEQMINPDTIFPEDYMIRYLLGYDKTPVEASPIRVILGSPFLRRAGGEPTNGKDIGERIANLLPPDRRGAWA